MVPPPTRSPDNRSGHHPNDRQISTMLTAAKQRGEKAMEKVLLTVDEAAEQLAVSRWTMYRLMKERYVVSVQVGRCRRVTAASLVQYVAALVDGVA